ncbi:MAG: hypothetical protein V4577_26800 [Bacteroidota bacterium]
MKKFKSLILLSFLGAAIFSGCQKDHTKPQNQGNNNPPPAGARIVRVGDSTNNNQFEYDAANNLAKLIVVADSNAYPYSISYQNGVPAKLQSPIFTTDLHYAGGLLTRTQVYQNNSPDVQSMVLFNYVNGTLSEQLFYEREFNATTLSPWLKYEIETLPGGDISKISFFIWDRTHGVYNYLGFNQYEYDTHSNPVYQLKDFTNLFNFPATPHNIKKENNFDTSGTLIGTVVYDYTYNDAGNPVKAIRTQAPTGGFSTVSTVSYTYK